ncbi:MAG: hypothetical protein KKA90_00040 [Nanoarchaeota archaeon]|nr:hypothetical protein [Nanoarchaeota archaeon]
MDRREIVQRFLVEGKLITPETLSKITEQNINNFISEKKEPRQDAITISFSYEKEQPTQFKSTEVVALYTKRFKKLRDLLMNKISAVSLQHIGKQIGDITVIGRIEKHDPKGFLLNDGTGSIVVSTKKNTFLGDVVGVRGRIKEGVLFAIEIIYPDIPLTRKRPHLVGTLTLTTNETTEKNALSIKKGPHIITTNPCWVTVKSNNNNGTLLYYQPSTPIDITTIKEWLQRRYIPHPLKPLVGNDPFLLNPIPDIFWVQTNEQFTHAYKGVLIISLGSGKAVINLNSSTVQFS